jgi:putative membrane protein
MESVSKEKLRALKLGIWVLSIVIWAVVALLFTIKIEGFDTSFLPPTYATINGLTAIVLVGAVVAIKRGKRKLHERLIKFALVLSVLFLLGYVIRHITSESVPYGDKDSSMYWIYIFILITHVFLSIAVIPLVLFTYLRAYVGDFEGHKKLAKKTFPIWLYVAVTGVIVYMMISPYY